MNLNNTEIEEIIDPASSAPHPRPISARECGCGCEHYFYPRRRDNIYLNKQHADFAYNHGKRKDKNKNRVRDEKILLKNDNILEKHFTSAKGQDEIERFYDIIKADGFKSGYNIGRINLEEKEFHITYSYMYHLYKTNEVFKIIIKKR